MSPIYTRKYLRQALGQYFVHDTYVANTYGSIGANGSVWLGDSLTADPTASGALRYIGSWLYHPDTQQVWRCASWNAPSGAFVTGQLTSTTLQSGSQFEVHEILSPFDKNAAVDRTINRVTARQEVLIPTTDGARFYQIDNTASPYAGSPNYIRFVLDAYYYADPTNSTNRMRGVLGAWDIVLTGTGRELRITPALGASQALVVDAIVDLTLGSAETATVNLPDDDWVLWGAAAHGYNDLIARTPGQPNQFFMQRRLEAAQQFTRLSGKFQPSAPRKLRLDERPQRSQLLLDDRIYG